MLGELLIGACIYDWFKDDPIDSKPEVLKEIIREVYPAISDTELNRRVKDMEYEMKEIKRRHMREDKERERNHLKQLY
jgi:E3 ubiquitin-protein ligase DOA10